MKENKYDEEVFFGKYSSMNRSTLGLAGAGEWHILKDMLPGFAGKRVLDIGCGFGWHCIYAARHGAEYVKGIDISEKMKERAVRENKAPNIEYQRIAMEDYSYPEGGFDIVISSLVFHYLESFRDIADKVYKTLRRNGSFVFSVEHPVFTAQGDQEWIYGPDGEPAYWPVDNYFIEGARRARFLGEDVVKYHRTLTSYLNGLLQAGFHIKEIREPYPDEGSLASIPEMKDEMRRPMMLIISATKGA